MIYEFINTETEEVFQKHMRMSELDEYLAANPSIKRHYSAAPSLGDSARLGRIKPDANFRDMLKHISKRAGSGSTIKYD